MNAHVGSGRTGFASVVLLFASSLSAQEAAPRGRLAGWVKGGDGMRVVGAAVTLVSRPLPARVDLGMTDEIHVATGADGMFRTELLHGRAYTAWATWRDAAGVEQRTAVLEGVIPGPPRELLATAPQVLRRLRVEGTAAWAERAPLTCTLFGEGHNALPRRLVLDAEGQAELPTLPGRYCNVEVRGRDGFVIALSRELYQAEAGKVEATLVLPAARELRVRVLDDKQQPIAGAVVRHALSYHRRDLSGEVGRTDAEGRVRAVVPATNLAHGDGADSFNLVVTAAGRQRQIAFCEWKTMPEELVFRLPVGIALRGRLLAGDGAPVRGITLLPECYVVGRDAETTGMGTWLRPCPLDAEGRFVFDSLHPKSDFRLLAMMEPAAAIAAGIRFRPDVAIAPLLWLAVGKDPFTATLDLGELRFDQLVATCIEVRDHGGAPVPGARLEVTTQHLYNSPLSYVTDRVGRLQFVLPQGEFRIGAWVKGGGVATRLVHVPAREGEPPLSPLVMTLLPMRTVRGVVVDAAGKPVADAVVRQFDRAKIADRDLAELTFHTDAQSDPTGSDGAFTLTLPLADAAFVIKAYAKIDGKPFLCGHTVGADDSDRTPIRMQLEPWQPKK